MTSVLSLQMGDVWNELQPKLGCLFGGSNGLKPHFWTLRGRGGRRSRTGKIICSANFRKMLNAHIFFFSPHSAMFFPLWSVLHSIQREDFNDNGHFTLRLSWNLIMQVENTVGSPSKFLFSYSCWLPDFHFFFQIWRTEYPFDVILEHLLYQTWGTTVYNRFYITLSAFIT